MEKVQPDDDDGAGGFAGRILDFLLKVIRALLDKITYYVDSSHYQQLYAIFYNVVTFYLRTLGNTFKSLGDLGAEMIRDIAAICGLNVEIKK